MPLLDTLTASHKEVIIPTNDYIINTFLPSQLVFVLLCNACCKDKGSAFAYLIEIMQG